MQFQFRTKDDENFEGYKRVVQSYINICHLGADFVWDHAGKADFLGFVTEESEDVCHPLPEDPRYWYGEELEYEGTEMFSFEDFEQLMKLCLPNVESDVLKDIGDESMRRKAYNTLFATDRKVAQIHPLRAVLIGHWLQDDQVYIDIVCATKHLKGAGKMLIQQFLRWLSVTYPQVKCVKLHALPYVISYYLSLGFRFRQECNGENLNLPPPPPPEGRKFWKNNELYEHEEGLEYLYDLAKRGFAKGGKCTPQEFRKNCRSRLYSRKCTDTIFRCGQDGFAMYYDMTKSDEETTEE